MDELIRSRMHEALDAVPPPANLSALRTLPAERPAARSAQPLKFEWALGVIAALLAIAVVVGLLYTHGFYRPAPIKSGDHGLDRPGAAGMSTPNIGWAVGGGTSVLRTTDGGAHWRNVTPAGYSSHSIELWFVDGEHAWVTEDVGTDSFAVYRTSDGGATWQRGAPMTVTGLDGRGPKVLYFLDATHGWLMGSSINPVLPMPDSFEFEFLYGTADGGAHWKRLADPRDNPPGCPWLGMSFSTPTTGWMTTYCGPNGGRPQLFATRDGGRTWDAQSIAFGPADGGVLAAPTFFDATHGILAGEGPDSTAFVASTSDGGISWIQASLPGSVVDASSFLDPLHGWMIAGSADLTKNDASLAGVLAPLYRTDDGGTTWIKVETDLPLVTPNGRVQDLWFVSRLVGFALADEAVLDYTVGTRTMYVTRDGGKSWKPVGSIPS